MTNLRACTRRFRFCVGRLKGRLSEIPYLIDPSILVIWIVGQHGFTPSRLNTPHGLPRILDPVTTGIREDEQYNSEQPIND
jgi:hypothetical protein